MTPDEFKAALEAVKAETTSAISAIKATAAEQAAELDRVKSHNKRLLVDLKKAKVKVRPAADEVEDDADEDDTAAEPDSRVAALEKKLAEAEARNADKASRAAIADAMDAAKIAPAFRAAVAALIRAGRKVEVKGDDVLIDGKAAKEAVAEWAATDDGKIYVAAPASGVIGGNGGNAGKPAKGAPDTTKRKSEFDTKARYKFVAEHGHAAWAALPA